MQIILRGAIASSLLLAGVAQASPDVTATNFSLTNFWGGEPDLVVLSDDGRTTQIAAKDLFMEGPLEAIGGPVPSRWGSPGFGNYDLDVRAGYRITGITVSGTVTGELAVGIYPPEFGDPYAINSISYRFSAGSEEGTWMKVENVNGTQQFSFTSQLGLQGKSFVGIDTNKVVEAAGYGPTYEQSSRASISVRDVIMTVQIAPVPEPGTYAMLLAGLALVGVAARRRK